MRGTITSSTRCWQVFPRSRGRRSICKKLRPTITSIRWAATQHHHQQRQCFQEMKGRARLRVSFLSVVSDLNRAETALLKERMTQRTSCVCSLPWRSCTSALTTSQRSFGFSLPSCTWATFTSRDTR